MAKNTTLSEYFTKHPKFRPSGNFEVIDDNTVRYCGVPLDATLWKMLKENRLNDPIPTESLSRLESL